MMSDTQKQVQYWYLKTKSALSCMKKYSAQLALFEGTYHKKLGAIEE